MRTWTLAAIATILAFAGAASATDTIRLGGPSAQAAIQGGTDTELVHWRRYGYRQSFRPYYGGYNRAYYGGFNRPYYGSYYRPYYYPRFYSYYTPSYYSTYSYPSYYLYYEMNRPTYYPSSCYYYPIAGESVAPPATTLNYQGPQPYVPPMPPADNGTYPYNGGPSSPVPMPNAEPAPRGIIPIDGRLVSLPSEISGGTSQVGVPAAKTQTTPRVSYPAYGEEPIPPAPRKVNR